MPAMPIVKLIKVKDVKKHLPADTKFVDQEQRRAAIKLRRNGLLRVFGDT
jgi:hypothetical protein